MSNLSALNNAILAGQRLAAAGAALHTLRAAYQSAKDSGMSSSLRVLLSNAERELLNHESALRQALDDARKVAQRTAVFMVGDVAVDVPEGFIVERIDIDGYRRIGVAEKGTSRFCAIVRTVEANGDDVGGFLIETLGETQDQVYSSERIALKAIMMLLKGE